MKKVGLVGWRGMVGSVLMQRMQQENDFKLIDPVFFSTSNAGGAAPAFAQTQQPLQSASDIAALKAMDIVILARVVTTPKRFIPNCGRAAGRVTGSMQPRRCAWKTTA